MYEYRKYNCDAIQVKYLLMKVYRILELGSNPCIDTRLVSRWESAIWCYASYGMDVKVEICENLRFWCTSNYLLSVIISLCVQLWNGAVRTFRLMIWALIFVPIMCDFRMSPTLNKRQSLLSRRQITACRLNKSVCERFLGLDNFANTIPTMKHWIITPTTDWRHNINTASGHSSEM